MNVFVGLDDFKSLNVGFALDEGFDLGCIISSKRPLCSFFYP